MNVCCYRDRKFHAREQEDDCKLFYHSMLRFSYNGRYFSMHCRPRYSTDILGVEFQPRIALGKKKPQRFYAFGACYSAAWFLAANFHPIQRIGASCPWSSPVAASMTELSHRRANGAITFFC